MTVRKGIPPRTFHVLFWSVPAAGGRPELRQASAGPAPASQTSIAMGRAATRNGRAPPRPPPWLSYARDHLILMDDGADARDQGAYHGCHAVRTMALRGGRSDLRARFASPGSVSAPSRA